MPSYPYPPMVFRRPIMLKNYFIIALRTIRRHRGYAFINVVGLAVGLAACLLILLFVRHELSYDRLHEKADRIVRVIMEVGDFGKTSRVPVAALRRFKEDFPEIEAATHVYRRSIVVRRDGGLVEEPEILYADSAFFDVFSFPLVAGDPNAVLRDPGAVVLTRSAARRHFDEADPLGRELVLNDGSTLRVTGLMEDVPSNSHLQFEALLSLTTLPGLDEARLGFQGGQYLLLTTPEAATAIDAKLDELTAQDSEAVFAYFGWWMTNLAFDLQPLTDIHLRSTFLYAADGQSDIRYLYLFSLIAAFILLLACINYMNLATARAAQRAREVGVRKTLGAHRRQLAGQFLGESLVLSGAALLLAMAMVEALLPLFNAVAGKTLRPSYDPATLALFGGVALVAGLLAGSYPAFLLSRFQPVRALRGAGPKSGGAAVRKVLVTFQFAVTVVLLVATLVVEGQRRYMQEKRLGYETEQVLHLPLKGGLQVQAEPFKAEARRLPGVAHAALAGGLPGFGEITTTREQDDKTYFVKVLRADPDYLATMGMRLVAGRYFDAARPADTAAVVMTEEAARFFEMEERLDEPEALEFWGAQTPIGIVRDFHTASLHKPMEPTLIVQEPGRYDVLVLRLEAGRVAETVAALSGLWRQFAPEEPFRYTFFDEMLARLYRAEQQLGRLFGAFTILALFIACLGLFGLAAFTAEQRTKEIGIRKVLGASVTHLAALLSKDFLKLIGIAFVVAAPVAYLAMAKWLEAFAYRIDLSWLIFLAAGSLALAISLLTVSYQAIKAALADPVKSLRYE